MGVAFWQAIKQVELILFQLEPDNIGNNLYSLALKALIEILDKLKMKNYST